MKDSTVFIAQIPFKYCQKDNERHSLITYYKQTFKILRQIAILNAMKNMKFAPKRPVAFKFTK